MVSDDGFMDYMVGHVKRIAATLDPEMTARDFMLLLPHKRAEYLGTIQFGIDKGLIESGGLSDFDYAAFWRAVIARVKELESEASDA